MHEYHQMFSNMPCFVLQKAVFYNTKGHLLQCKRWPSGNALIYSGMPLIYNSIITCTLSSACKHENSFQQIVKKPV